MKDLYKGPGPFDDEEPKKDPVELGEYTPADQARSWDVPEDELSPEVPEPRPPSGLPRSFWRTLGIGKED